MAGKRFEKGSKEWNMFQDFWKMAQNFYIPEDDQGYWRELTNEQVSFEKKYKNTPLALEMNVALGKALDKMCGQNKNDKRSDN